MNLEISTDYGHSWQKAHALKGGFRSKALWRYEENRIIIKQRDAILAAVKTMTTNSLVTPVKLSPDGRYAEFLIWLLRRAGLKVTYRGHYFSHCMITIEKP